MSFGFGYRSAVQVKKSHDKCLGINQTLGAFVLEHVEVLNSA